MEGDDPVVPGDRSGTVVSSAVLGSLIGDSSSSPEPVVLTTDRYASALVVVSLKVLVDEVSILRQDPRANRETITLLGSMDSHVLLASIG
jgi:hypothetical protein